MRTAGSRGTYTRPSYLSKSSLLTSQGESLCLDLPCPALRTCIAARRSHIHACEFRSCTGPLFAVFAKGLPWVWTSLSRLSQSERLQPLQTVAPKIPDFLYRRRLDPHLWARSDSHGILAGQPMVSGSCRTWDLFDAHAPRWLLAWSSAAVGVLAFCFCPKQPLLELFKQCG